MSKISSTILNLKQIADSIPEPRELSGKTTLIFPSSRMPMSKWFRKQYGEANCTISVSMVSLLNAVVTDGRPVFFNPSIKEMREIIKNDANLTSEQKAIELPGDEETCYFADLHMVKLCSLMLSHGIINHIEDTEDVYHVIHPIVRSFLPECYKVESYEKTLIEEFRSIYVINKCL